MIFGIDNHKDIVHTSRVSKYVHNIQQNIDEPVIDLIIIDFSSENYLDFEEK